MADKIIQSSMTDNVTEKSTHSDTGQSEKKGILVRVHNFIKVNQTIFSVIACVVIVTVLVVAGFKVNEIIEKNATPDNTENPDV